MKFSVRHYRPLALLIITGMMSVLANAQQLIPLFGNGAGEISDMFYSSLDTAQIAKDQFVTAVVNSTGNLEVIAWQADFNNNQLARQGTGYAGTVNPSTNGVVISSPFGLNGTSGAFTTAMVATDGLLDLVYWQVQPNGSISLLSEVHGDFASFVSIAWVYNNPNTGNPQFTTAIANGTTGNLEVTLWYVDSTNQIRPSYTASAGTAYTAHITCLPGGNSDVVTAVTNSADQLELIQWHYDSAGKVSRENTAYSVTNLDNANIAPGVASFSNSSNPVNAFYTVEMSANDEGQFYVSAWNQSLGLQASVFQGSDCTKGSIPGLAGFNTEAILVTPSWCGIGSNEYSYWVQVFDQSGSNGFMDVADLTVGGLLGLPVSVTLVENSPNVLRFAMTYPDGNNNLQIQVWQYVRACSPHCPKIEN